MQKLSSFGQGKKIRPKKSLMWLMHEALQLLFVGFLPENHFHIYYQLIIN